MKKLFNIILLSVAVFFASSCGEKESLGVTQVTYFPVIELVGDSELLVEKGAEYLEPGYTAVMNGEDVTDQVQVTSTVDASKSGIYSVTYSMTNEDGFSASTSRKVIVLDSTDPWEGFYTTTKLSFNNSSAHFTGPFQTLLIGLGDGVYSSTDLLGGWYEQGRKIGNAAMSGKIKIDGTTITVLDSFLPYWGDSLDNIFEGVADSENNVLSWNTSYAGYPVVVEITKN